MIRLMRRSAAAVAQVVLAAGQVPGTARAADERPDLKIEMVDCGRSGMFDPAAPACFEERFRACESATWIPEISLGGGTLAQRWEVVGPAETGCTVRNEYVAYSNPAYLGKEMLCTFDHGRPFAEAVGDWRACDGPLLDLMVGVGDPEREFAVERGGARQVERTTPPGGGSVALTVRRPLRAEYLGRGEGGYAVAVPRSGGRQVSSVGDVPGPRLLPVAPGQRRDNLPAELGSFAGRGRKGR